MHATVNSRYSVLRETLQGKSKHNLKMQQLLLSKF